LKLQNISNNKLKLLNMGRFIRINNLCLLSILICGIVFTSCNKNTNVKVNYGRPFETPTKPAFIPLPPGSVEPQGWLRDWCLTARDGYTGHLDEYDVAFRQAWAADYKPTGENLCYWDKGAWPLEGGGYWFDGLVKLGYILHDDSLLNKAKSRLDVVVNNMTDSSILFIWWLNRNKPADMSEKEAGNDDWFPKWASGLMGRSLAAYYAGSGDPRVLRAIEMAYSDNYNWLRKRFAQSSIYPSMEAYTWTGNKKIQASLTELFEKRVNKNPPWLPVEIGMPVSIVMPDEKSPWYEQAGHYGGNDGGWVNYTNVHGVHFLECASPWALGYLWTGKPEFLKAVSLYFDMIERNGMQPYGVFVSDEFCGPNGAFRGTETCNVSGYMWSQIELLRIGGSGVMGDRIERAFFNAAPAVVSRDFTSHVYKQFPNRIVPGGVRCNYKKTNWPLCCTASLNRMLPNYVVNMWMATYNNGLAATCYGPCKVSALVSDHIPVELTCQTDYPFNDVIDITVKPLHKTTFPLYFRIPGWCKNPSLLVNGSVIKPTPDANGFVCIERRWKPDDRIRLQFPMEVRVITGSDSNADGATYASVYYGPVLFALPIPYTKDLNTPDSSAKWKYALETQGNILGSDITVEHKPMPARWNWPVESPIQLHVNVVGFDWNGKALPVKPVTSGGIASEKVTLIPYGCTQFRVSMFPVTEQTFNLSRLENPVKPEGN
jgi:uncharacterized protein